MQNGKLKRPGPAEVGAGSSGGAGPQVADVAAVVVSFNTRSLTMNCVDALCLDGSLASVCVVDNASGDGSREALLQRACMQHAQGDAPSLVVECLERNIGFGGANNVGVALTQGDYVALVNSDAFVLNGAIETMRDYLNVHPSVGVVGPRLLNLDGSFQESRFPFPSPWRAWAENLGIGRLKRLLRFRERFFSGGVDWLSGACLVMRRSVWMEVGGFDEAFFLYSEETDLQKRIRKAGWEIHWVPESLVTHLGGGSGGARKEEVKECFYEGVDRYFLKHYGRTGALMLRTATAFGACLRWLGALMFAKAERRREAGWILRRQALSPLPGGARQP